MRHHAAPHPVAAAAAAAHHHHAAQSLTWRCREWDSQVSLACGSLAPGRRTDTTHWRGHGLYCTTHTSSCGRDHTTTINYCESRALDQMPAACLQCQEDSPWLQSATTAAQLISKPSSRDGPQPGYRPAQLCAVAHPGQILCRTVVLNYLFGVFKNSQLPFLASFFGENSSVRKKTWLRNRTNSIPASRGG